MFATTVCVQQSRPLLRLVEGCCWHALSRSGRSAPVNVSHARAFRLTPLNPASMRSRFGRSQLKSENQSSSPMSIDLSRAAIAAGAALGLGGLCYYGMRSTSAGADALSVMDRASIWPEHVRHRVKMTYAYLAAGATIAAGTAVALSRSATFCRAMMGSGWIAPIGMMIASMGAGVVCQMIPYPSSGGVFNSKHLAWTVFSASIGGMLMPICLIGGPIITRAVLYTGGIVGGLSIVATTAPSDKFLYMGGPLAIGLGVIVVSSLGSMFLSPVSRLGSGMAAISLYGGLILFSGFLLYDTQMVVRRAESYPPPSKRFSHAYGDLPIIERSFDPINNSIHILLDIVNIFVRMVAIFSGGQNRRK
ncbi:unnamed protein product [Dicrocoelium dendriticum]|nr:unnamed protein product [Dicrocoelium dendriticum]